jgi:hypothetical protein
MTIPEMADVAGCSERTIRRIVAEKMPGKIKNGKVTRFDKQEAEKIMEMLPKRNMVGNPGQMSKLPMTNVQGSERIDRLETMVEKLISAMAVMVSQPKQLEIIQDYYTIKGYASKIKSPVTYSDAVALGREARRLSILEGTEIRKADDERFGIVNSYHVDILRQVFAI